MSDLEEVFSFQLRAVGLEGFVREYAAIPGRRFRFDFAFTEPHHRLLVEVQGGIWQKSGHTSGRGVTRDMEKLNLAQLAGWRVMQFSRGMIESGEALEMIAKALGVEL